MIAVWKKWFLWFLQFSAKWPRPSVYELDVRSGDVITGIGIFVGCDVCRRTVDGTFSTDEDDNRVEDFLSVFVKKKINLRVFCKIWIFSAHFVIRLLKIEKFNFFVIQRFPECSSAQYWELIDLESVVVDIEKIYWFLHQLSVTPKIRVLT